MGESSHSPATRRRRQVRIDPAVARELRAIIRQYEAIDPAVASRFAIAVDRAVTAARIGLLSIVVPVDGLDVPIRRILVNRFPYAVYFLSLEETVRILAVVHQRRHPDDWRRRLRR
jgi:plasmid stabilization system protein ParE